MWDLVDKVPWLQRNNEFARRLGANVRALAERMTPERELKRGVPLLPRSVHGRPALWTAGVAECPARPAGRLNRVLALRLPIHVERILAEHRALLRLGHLDWQRMRGI